MNQPNSNNKKNPSGNKSKNNSNNRNRNKNKKKAFSHKKKTPVKASPEDDSSKKDLSYADYHPQKPKNFKFITFDSFTQAKDGKHKISELCDDCDRLNIVIKAEGNMTDPELVEISPKIQIYAGEAWSLIHSRRLEEKWYDTPH